MPLDRILRNLIKWQRADGLPIPAREMTVEDARERYRASSVRPRRADSDPAVTTADELVATRDGSSFPVRIYTPESDAGRVVTFLHGGGWSLGDIESHDWVCRAMAAALNAVVVSADYRRAPEFPYPIPLHDAIAAARCTQRNFPGREHIIAGDSAGANLALGVILNAQDLEFAAQLLVYPPVDPYLRYAAASPHADGYLLSVDDMAFHYAQYVPDPLQRNEPAVDLLNADLRGMPPTVIATAEFDPLHDEAVELAARMSAAGVHVRHVPGPGLVHGYFLMQDLVPAAAACAQLVLHELDAMLRSAQPAMQAD